MAGILGLVTELQQLALWAVNPVWPSTWEYSLPAIVRKTNVAI